MSILQKLLVIVCCLFLLTGCYEDEVEITLDTDGSGTIKGTLIISERLIVATSENGGHEKAPPVNKEGLLAEIGSAVEITSITLGEQPDGSSARALRYGTRPERDHDGTQRRTLASEKLR